MSLIGPTGTDPIIALLWIEVASGVEYCHSIPNFYWQEIGSRGIIYQLVPNCYIKEDCVCVLWQEESECS
jgi:hypothetical protein